MDRVEMGVGEEDLGWSPTTSEDLLPPDMFHIPGNAIKTATSMYKKEPNCPAFVHICGNTIDLIPKIPDIGADCFSFNHTVGPGLAKKQAGRKIVLMGNIDPVKYPMMGPPQKITEQSYRTINERGADSGLILVPDCETPISPPDENVIAIGNAGKEYWKTQV